VLAAQNGYALVKFFFLLTFAAAIPAIVSAALRARPLQIRNSRHLRAGWAGSTPFMKASSGTANYGIQDWLAASAGANSMTLPVGGGACHGWLDRGCLRVAAGCPTGALHKDGMISAHRRPISRFWRSGAWILTVGWFGFNACRRS